MSLLAYCLLAYSMSSFTLKSRYNQGFTLFELLVVVGIAALIFALIIPEYVAQSQQVQLKMTAEHIVSLVAEARESTRSGLQKNDKNLFVGVHIEHTENPDTNTVILFSADYIENFSVANWAFPANANVIRQFSFPAPINFKENGNQTIDIVFAPPRGQMFLAKKDNNGTLNPSSLTLNLQSANGFSKKITFDAISGQIKIE